MEACCSRISTEITENTNQSWILLTNKIYDYVIWISLNILHEKGNGKFNFICTQIGIVPKSKSPYAIDAFLFILIIYFNLKNKY